MPEETRDDCQRLKKSSAATEAENDDLPQSAFSVFIAVRVVVARAAMDRRAELENAVGCCAGSFGIENGGHSARFLRFLAYDCRAVTPRVKPFPIAAPGRV